MSYTIFNTDGSILVLLPDNFVDEVSTSLSLIGRNVNGFGQYINNNFIKLAANFASESINGPRNPIKGQLWYDTTEKKIKVYDNGFKPVSGAIVSPTRPATVSTGDLWYDTTNGQLKIINGTSSIIIGPSFTKTIGETGIVLPPTSVRDDNLIVKNVSFLKNYGNLVGIVSHEAYTVNILDATTYFNTSTMSIVSGLKIFGDINYTGKINNNYHTLTVDLDHITSATNSISELTHVTSQTNVIIDMLNTVFPINTLTSTISNPYNENSIEVGVPVGSEARVICYHTIPFKGYQVRKFQAISSETWDYVDLTGSLIFSTLSNVVRTVSLP